MEHVNLCGRSSIVHAHRGNLRAVCRRARVRIRRGSFSNVENRWGWRRNRIHTLECWTSRPFAQSLPVAQLLPTSTVRTLPKRGTAVMGSLAFHHEWQHISPGWGHPSLDRTNLFASPRTSCRMKIGHWSTGRHSSRVRDKLSPAVHLTWQGTIDVLRCSARIAMPLMFRRANGADAAFLVATSRACLERSKKHTRVLVKVGIVPVLHHPTMPQVQHSTT